MAANVEISANDIGGLVISDSGAEAGVWVIAETRDLPTKYAKVVVTVDRHGNTSAASIPLALAVAVADGRIKQGDLVLLEAMGGGFTWGSALVRW